MNATLNFDSSTMKSNLLYDVVKANLIKNDHDFSNRAKSCVTIENKLYIRHMLNRLERGKVESTNFEEHKKNNIVERLRQKHKARSNTTLSEGTKDASGS